MLFTSLYIDLSLNLVSSGYSLGTSKRNWVNTISVLSLEKHSVYSSSLQIHHTTLDELLFSVSSL